MNKICKLTKNELIKIFARPLIYIMLILVIVLTFGNAFLTSFIQKQESNNYEQNWQNSLNSRLQNYNAVLSEESTPAEELERAKYGVETVQYMIDNNIRETDWKADVLNTILDLKMEKYLANQSGDTACVKELDDTIGQCNAYLEQDNWKGYVETMRSRTAADTQMDKSEREAKIEIYDMRLKYNIVPSPMPELYSYGYQQPWQEGVLESLQSALSSQKSGLNEYGQKLSEEEVLEAAAAARDRFSSLVLACLERI